MITAKDIHKKKFEKVKFGYSPEEVDAFLAQLEADVRLMEQEIADSNGKLQVLAERVSEYKESEDDIRNALVSAQRQAREVIEAATKKAAEIESEARSHVDSAAAEALADQETQLKSIESRLEQENQNLVETQKQVSAFKKALFEMYKKHLEMISRLPETAADIAPAKPKAEPAPAPAAETAQPAEDAAPAPAAETQAAPAAETQAAPAAEEAAEPVTEHTAPQFGSRRDDKKKRF